MKEKKSLQINSKLPRTGSTIFSVMSALATEHKAINLSQGFPDFDVEPRLLSLVEKYLQAGFNQYAPMPGVLSLREALVGKTYRNQGHLYDANSEITITAGATQAIAAVLSTVIRAGDEVIVFTPAYDCYVPYIELNGGIPVYVKLQHPDYTIAWDQVKKVVNHKTRMIIINTPHNPTATVLKANDLDKLEEITDGSDILILSDEVYEHIVFDREKHLSVCSRPQLYKRSFITGSLGKTLHVTGWKIGYCLAPKQFMEEFRKVHQFMVFSVNTPAQYAIGEFLEDDANFAISKMYEGKRDQFLQAIKGSRFKPLYSQGSYFQLLDYSAISDEPDIDFARQLTIEHGVASIPLSVFYNNPTDHKVLRFCFAKNEKTLHAAGSLLSQL